MEFLINITPIQILGLVLLGAGAVLSFAAKRIASRFSYAHADMICRLIGLGVVIAGFVIIFI